MSVLALGGGAPYNSRYLVLSLVLDFSLVGKIDGTHLISMLFLRGGPPIVWDACSYDDACPCTQVCWLLYAHVLPYLKDTPRYRLSLVFEVLRSLRSEISLDKHLDSALRPTSAVFPVCVSQVTARIHEQYLILLGLISEPPYLVGGCSNNHGLVVHHERVRMNV